MNLRGIANSVTTSINPNILGTIQVSTGYTTGTDFVQVPSYTTYSNVSMQVQDLSTPELSLIDGINIQGDVKSVYLNGNWNGIVRPESKGGDLLAFNDMNWKVLKVAEQWPDWTRVIVIRQMAAS